MAVLDRIFFFNDLSFQDVGKSDFKKPGARGLEKGADGKGANDRLSRLRPNAPHATPASAFPGETGFGFPRWPAPPKTTSNEKEKKKKLDAGYTPDKGK